MPDKKITPNTLVLNRNVTDHTIKPRTIYHKGTVPPSELSKKFKEAGFLSPYKDVIQEEPAADLKGRVAQLEKENEELKRENINLNHEIEHLKQQIAASEEEAEAEEEEDEDD